MIRCTRLPVTVVEGSLTGDMRFEEAQREHDVTADDTRAALRSVGELTEQESLSLSCAGKEECDCHRVEARLPLLEWLQHSHTKWRNRRATQRTADERYRENSNSPVDRKD
jgi:hypothetical protein